MDRRYEVFISSTFVDLEDERAKVMRAVLQLDCFPAGMELFPAADASQWNVIQRAIDRCDYYIVLVAGRYGSLGENNLSYTEQEFDYAVKQGIPVLAFVHGNPDSIPFGKTDKNDVARQRLEAFREKVSTGRVRNTWLNPDDLAAKVTQALVNAFKTSPRHGWTRGQAAVAGDEAAAPATLSPLSPIAFNRQVRLSLQEHGSRFEELLNDALHPPSEYIASIDAQHNLSQGDYLARVKQCEDASVDLIQIATEAGYFGKEDHHRALLAATEQLSALNDIRSGYTALIKLRAYPSVLIFYAAGIAAVAKQNYALVRKFHEMRLSDPAYGRGPALTVLSPAYALDGPIQVPRPDGSRLKTPQSDRVLDAVRPSLMRLPLVNDRRCEDLFAQFEYLNALAAAVGGKVHPHYGRFLWYGADSFRGSSLAATTDSEIAEQAAEWSPFKARLFGSDLEAFKKAKAEFDQQIRHYNLVNR